jgi:acyl-CoA reductase-like NAD-dependent aldehyde dehydrogenase
MAMIDQDKIYLGGRHKESSEHWHPLFFKCSPGDKVMGEEIFGPILPVIYDSLDSATRLSNQNQTALTLSFTETVH